MYVCVLMSRYIRIHNPVLRDHKPIATPALSRGSCARFEVDERLGARVLQHDVARVCRHGVHFEPGFAHDKTFGNTEGKVLHYLAHLPAPIAAPAASVQ